MRQPSLIFRKAAGASCVLLVAALMLAACGTGGDKIGSTVKGTRVAVMENIKAIQPDTGLDGLHPDLPEMVANASWPQAGYDVTHVMPNAAVPVHPQILWTADAGEGSSGDFKLLARPIISGGRVFTMDAQGLVSAFDTRSGDLIWEFDTTPENRDENAIGGGLATANGTVYATTGFGEVLALNTTDGAVKWRRMLQNPLRAAPTVAGGRVFVVSIDNELQALDARTGEPLWHHNGISESATLMGASSPAVVGDSVIVAYSSGEIYSLRTENGRAAWSYALTTPTQVGALPAIADIRGLPVLDHGQVFAVSHSGRMASIDQRSGDRSWENDVGGITTPVVAGDTVFVLTTDDHLLAVARDSGRVMWVKDMQHFATPNDHTTDPVYWSGPVLGHSLLWMTNSLGQLVSFSPGDGSTIDTIDIGAPSYIPPVIAGGVIYVVADDGTLVALH